MVELGYYPWWQHLDWQKLGRIATGGEAYKRPAIQAGGAWQKGPFNIGELTQFIPQTWPQTSRQLNVLPPGVPNIPGMGQMLDSTLMQPQAASAQAPGGYQFQAENYQLPGDIIRTMLASTPPKQPAGAATQAPPAAAAQQAPGGYQFNAQNYRMPGVDPNALKNFAGTPMGPRPQGGAPNYPAPAMRQAAPAPAPGQTPMEWVRPPLGATTQFAPGPAPAQYPQATMSQASGGGQHPGMDANLGQVQPTFGQRLGEAVTNPGFIAMLAQMGAAISPPGTFGERLGTATAGLAQNQAAQQYEQLAKKQAEGKELSATERRRLSMLSAAVAPMTRSEINDRLYRQAMGIKEYGLAERRVGLEGRRVGLGEKELGLAERRVGVEQQREDRMGKQARREHRLERRREDRLREEFEAGKPMEKAQADYWKARADEMKKGGAPEALKAPGLNDMLKLGQMQADMLFPPEESVLEGTVRSPENQGAAFTFVNKMLQQYGYQPLPSMEEYKRLIEREQAIQGQLIPTAEGIYDYRRGP